MITSGNELGDQSFHFDCHPGVACYMRCCRRLDMYLYPYDVLRLRKRLFMHSGAFMQRHTRLAAGSHPYFPAVMLLMEKNVDHTCPFLGKEGCTVYRDRPSACRTYPLERAVEKKSGTGRLQEHYFLTDHSYCLGHNEEKTYTVRQWIRDQQLHDYNLMNDLWAEVDAVFATNPWQGEGSGGPLQQLAFMVCYNIDAFREYVAGEGLLARFRLDRDRRRRIERDDTELLKFGFEWLQFILAGRRRLQPR